MAELARMGYVAVVVEGEVVRLALDVDVEDMLVDKVGTDSGVVGREGRQETRDTVDRALVGQRLVDSDSKDLGD